MNRHMRRRDVLKAGVGAGLVFLKPGILTAGRSPSDRLNLAIIGVGGRGRGAWIPLATSRLALPGPNDGPLARQVLTVQRSWPAATSGVIDA